MIKPSITPWQRLATLLKLDRKDISQTFYYAIFAGLVNLSLPLGIQAIINLIQGAQISTSWVILVILVTGGVAFAGLLQLMQIRIIENLQQKIFTRASFEFTYRFPKIKMSALHNYYPPELANRFFDTLNVQKGLAKILVDFPAALLQIIFGLLLLSFYHAFFIVYGLLLLLLIYVVFKFTVQKGLTTSLTESKAKYKVAHWIQEVARCLVSFKLSGSTNLALSKNDALVYDYLESRESHFRVLVHQFLQMIGFKVLVTGGLLLIGGLLVLNQEMNIGQFVAAEIIILLVINSVEKLIRGLETMYDLLTSLEKLGQVFDKDLEEQIEDAIIDPKDSFLVELDAVVLQDPMKGNTVLKGVSLTINPKDRILVQGPSGSGKTSLLRVITGLLEPDKGNIFVNNTALRRIRPNHYRSFLGQSLLDETPFEGSILENITFGDNAISEKAVHQVLEVVGLLDFVKDQPKGLRTIIYPEGKQIPFSVSRKIVLARSIVRQPKLLILKDPLAQFDSTEALRLIQYLSHKDRPWSLVVESNDELWKAYCNREIEMIDGTICNEKSVNPA